MTKEFIICSAIWFKDGKTYVHQPKNVDSGFVVCGRRHHNCYAILAAIKSNSGLTEDQIGNERYPREFVQGFLTNTDRFVDRKEGYTIAKEANQLIHNLHDRTNPILTSECLYSEDIY